MSDLKAEWYQYHPEDELRCSSCKSKQRAYWNIEDKSSHYSCIQCGLNTFERTLVDIPVLRLHLTDGVLHLEERSEG